METNTLRFKIGDRPHVIAVMINHDIVAPSLSGVYVKLHLPNAENPSKAAVQVGSNRVPTDVELTFERAEETALLEVNLTSGANARPYTVTIEVDGQAQTLLDGTTGTNTSQEFPLQ